MELQLLYHLLRRPVQTIKSADLLSYKPFSLLITVWLLGTFTVRFYYVVQPAQAQLISAFFSEFSILIFPAYFCAVTAVHAFTALVIARIRNEKEILFTTMLKLTVPFLSVPLCISAFLSCVLALFRLQMAAVYINAAIALLPCVYVYILFAYKLHSKTRAIVAAICWLCLWGLHWLPMMLAGGRML